jgi:uncharacterized iron-regulated protein
MNTPSICRRRLLLGAGTALLGACASQSPPATLAAAMRRRPLVLLGEVHDNATQHVLRLAAFEALVASGARPALLLEQLDHEHQAAIDTLRLHRPQADADAVTSAGQGSRSGWNWAFYSPFVQHALQHGLPVVAANLSRGEARKVMDQGLLARGFEPQVPEALLEAQATAVMAGHCGLIKATAARRLALAQIARDQLMARLLTAHSGGAVLLAGNGHVRTDIGAPAWLPAAWRAQSVAIGVLEEGDDSSAAFDHIVFTQRQARPDPCEALRKTPPR